MEFGADIHIPQIVTTVITGIITGDSYIFHLALSSCQNLNLSNTFKLALNASFVLFFSWGSCFYCVKHFFFFTVCLYEKYYTNKVWLTDQLMRVVLIFSAVSRCKSKKAHLSKCQTILKFAVAPLWLILKSYQDQELDLLQGFPGILSFRRRVFSSSPSGVLLKPLTAGVWHLMCFSGFIHTILCWALWSTHSLPASPPGVFLYFCLLWLCKTKHFNNYLLSRLTVSVNFRQPVCGGSGSVMEEKQHTPNCGYLLCSCSVQSCFHYTARLRLVVEGNISRSLQKIMSAALFWVSIEICMAELSLSSKLKILL